MGITAVKNAAIGLLVLALSACASSSVLVGNAREPIEPEQVRIYLEPPAAYETVALLEASDLGANGFSAQSRMNKVINRLKAEAADLGANGILLQGIDSQYTGSIGSGYVNSAAYGNSAYATGLGYSAAQYSKVGRAIAIYVPSAAPEPVPGATMTPEPHVPAQQLPPAPNAEPTTPPPTNSKWRNWGQKGS